jgi:hypothetical protein
MSVYEKIESDCNKLRGSKLFKESVRMLEAYHKKRKDRINDVGEEVNFFNEISLISEELNENETKSKNLLNYFKVIVYLIEIPQDLKEGQRRWKLPILFYTISLPRISNINR